ncbi:5-methylaminomethyl-2-thiouridylate-methyltransferase [Paxillus ammoniavirescens]|nr:5-methylaminomethyl-2-thiouridylate-methyltransferase [Paxillus ammoniavirescens]
MSGGVDSSVAAKILADKDYDLSAVFMRNWDTRDESGTDHGCEWKKDWEDVQRVCRMLDIPVRMVDLSREYWSRVFEPSLRIWQLGHTPNPDVWCNKEIKFGALLEHFAEDPAFLKVPWLATGHYAHKDWKLTRDSPRPRPRLLKPHDSTKDQTYYLSSMRETSLSRALFPLSGLKKTEVRELAATWKLPTATRKESMGICFVGEKRKFDEFLSQYVTPKPGPIIDITTGKQVAAHQGLWSHTIGQGAKISGLPQKMFVVKKDPETNTIFVAPGTDHPALYVNNIHVSDFNWVWADSPPEEVLQTSGLKARMKYRHRMTDIACTVYHDDLGMRIAFAEPQRAVAPGQIASIYLGDWCLGCGVVDSSE